MPLKLIPPGKRKGNRFYLVRGSVGGRRYEVSTATGDRGAAATFRRNLLDAISEGRVPGPHEAVTFRRAAELYLEFRDLMPKHPDRGRIARLGALPIGAKLCGEVVQADIVEAAHTLLPAAAPATRNREVVAVAAAVLHYAEQNKWCKWLRVRRFKEPRARTRAVTPEVARLLIANVPPPKQKNGGHVWHRKLLLTWLFRQGDRISDPLQVAWGDFDMEARTMDQRVGKTDEWRSVPLDDEVWQLLINAPNEVKRVGHVFPWRTRSGVYRWLRPMTRDLGVAFTPHQARHSLGKWLNDTGAGLKTIMATLGHADPKSSMRYQAGDVEVVRAARRRIGKLSG